jgi:hypothetical protein
MHLSGRLAKLEAADSFSPRAYVGDLPPDFLKREGRRWDDILSPLLDELTDKEAVRLTVMAACGQFSILVGLLNPAEPTEMSERLWRFWPLARRWPKALATVLGRLPPTMRCPTLRAGLTRPNDACTTQTWFEEWLHDLCELRSRVPPDISPEKLRSVVDVFLSRREQIDSHFGICPATGLRLPRVKSSPGRDWKVLPGKTPLVGPPPWYDCPEFFDSCPGCGADKYGILRCQLVSEKAVRQQDWRALAEQELAPP